MEPLHKTRRTGDAMQIVPGSGWQRFAFATPGLVYLGTIRRGMEIGALAMNDAGGYLQVNGDIHQILNRSRVAAHLRRAGIRPASVVPAGRPTTHAERPAVTVTVKRRRRILSAQTEP